MKFRPILFSTPMVQALLDGRKTQTRRIVKLKHLDISTIGAIHPDGSGKGWVAWSSGKGITAAMTKETYPGNVGFPCPYGQVGDVLWVRETFCNESTDGETWFFVHKAGNENYPMGSNSWKPSIHMPKSACRIFLEITEVRVELLHMLTAFDAQDEGIQPLLQSRAQLIEQGKLFRDYSKKPELFMDGVGAVQSYKTLWESINGLESWDANPWVWMISFKRIDKPEGFC